MVSNPWLQLPSSGGTALRRQGSSEGSRRQRLHRRPPTWTSSGPRLLMMAAVLLHVRQQVVAWMPGACWRAGGRAGGWAGVTDAQSEASFWLCIHVLCVVPWSSVGPQTCTAPGACVATMMMLWLQAPAYVHVQSVTYARHPGTVRAQTPGSAYSAGRSLDVPAAAAPAVDQRGRSSSSSSISCGQWTRCWHGQVRPPGHGRQQSSGSGRQQARGGAAEAW